MTSNFQNLMAKVEEKVAEQATEQKEEETKVTEEGAEENAETQPAGENESEEQEAAETEGEGAEEEAAEEQQVSDKDKNLTQALRKAEKETRAERDARIVIETENKQLKQALEHAISLMQGGDQKEEAKKEVANVDPLDPESHQFLVNKINELQKQIDSTKDDVKGTQQQTTFQAAMSQLATERAAFMATTPDLPQAVDHVYKAEFNKALMFGHNEEQAQQEAIKAVTAIGLNALQSGKNSAETIYKAAELYGYAKPSKTKPTGPNPAAIAKNKAKSEGISNIPGIGAGVAGATNPLKNKEAFKKAVCDEHGRVDYKKLAEVNKMIERQGAA